MQEIKLVYELKRRLALTIHNKVTKYKNQLNSDKIYFEETIDGITCISTQPEDIYGITKAYLSLKGVTLLKMKNHLEEGKVFTLGRYGSTKFKARPKI
jgi:hypothetical protein